MNYKNEQEIIAQYKKEIEKIEKEYFEKYKEKKVTICEIGKKGGSIRNAGYRAKREYIITELIQRKNIYDITPTFAKRIIQEILNRKVDFDFLIKRLSTKYRTASNKSKISEDEIQEIKNDIYPKYIIFEDKLHETKTNIQRKYKKELDTLKLNIIQ